MVDNDGDSIMLNMFTGSESNKARQSQHKKNNRARLMEKKRQKKIERSEARFERKYSQPTHTPQQSEHVQTETASAKVKVHDTEKGKDVPKRKEKQSSSRKPSATKTNKTSSLFRHNPEIPQVKSDDIKQTVEPVFSSDNFSDLNLHSFMVSNLENNFKISKMTSVQKQSIPCLLEGRDALIKSQTGTGKTLAYAVPMVESLQLTQPKIQRMDGPYAIVILPTRELALQSYEVIQKLTKPFVWIVPGCLIGGEKKKSEKTRIRKGINILVATPGRLVDHLENTETLKLNKVRWLVLDEADRLLDLGMEKDITAILNTLNEQTELRQTVLLSATLTEGVKNLAGISMNDPVSVNITHSQPNISERNTDNNISSERKMKTTDRISKDDFCTPEKLKQHFLIVPSKLRLVTLAAFILWQCKYAGHSKMLVFLSSRDSVEFHHTIFQNILNSEDDDDDDDDDEDIDFFQLHGNMSQDERTRVYHSFVECTSGVLLCTDVAARGLDLPGVKWIVQYNTPGTPAEYIHRVGRTARIGKEGQALLFLTPSEVDYVKTLNSHRLSLNEMDVQKILKTLLLYSNDDRNQRRKQQMTPQSIEESATALQAKFEHFVNDDRRHAELARKAYLSFIRAYATYPSTFKHIFHIKLLHLGHVAKSFALRETPMAVGHISSKMFKREQSRRESRKRQGSTPLKKFGVKRAKISTMSEFSSGLDSKQLVLNKFATKTARTKMVKKRK
ncbi:ATP-dependent DNA helicase DDX31-like [Ptychodera flava]|uniref:ATP-dependent DNA helicase DDX31-like n=1 Tax=Ptychodera flava TaxID=63121 RepID=UPI00396A7C88